jgi:hypothetical protein
MQDRLKALELAKGLEPVAANIERVSAETSPEAASWAFTQWRLRRKASAKFTQASEMLFGAEALEQSTHEMIAYYHAYRFPKDVLVADLTTGIGGDLLALSRRGPVIGCETDKERAVFARHNLRVNGLEGQIVEEDGLSYLTTPANNVTYAYADPSRRVLGRRILDIEQFEPNPHKLAQAMANIELGGIKLSPMLSDSDLASVGDSLEFVSFDGECREALIWAGRQAKPGRWAVRVESGNRLEASDMPYSVGEPQRYLFEADPAAIRAHCIGSLCKRHDLYPLGDSNGYLTSDQKNDSEWLKPYRVVSTCPADEKITRATLGQLGYHVAVVKTRTSGVDPELLQKKLRTQGRKPITLIVYAVGKSRRYILATPINPENRVLDSKS